MTPETIAAIQPLALAIVALLSAVMVYLQTRQAAKLTKVAEQTDGLARSLADATGQVEHARGVTETKQTATNEAAAKAAQNEMIEGIVSRLLAAQTALLVKPNGDPLTGVQTVVDAVEGLTGAMQATGEDTNKRVIRVEEATVHPPPPAP